MVRKLAKLKITGSHKSLACVMGQKGIALGDCYVETGEAADVGVCTGSEFGGRCQFGGRARTWLV